MAHIESSLIFLSDYIIFHVNSLNRKEQLISRFPYFPNPFIFIKEDYPRRLICL